MSVQVFIPVDTVCMCKSIIQFWWLLIFIYIYKNVPVKKEKDENVIGSIVI